MRIGELRHLVTIRVPTRTQSATTNEQTISTYTDSTAWAQIETLSAYERMLGAALDAEATVRITIRYNSAVTAGCLITHGSKTYHVMGVDNVDERNIMLRLNCRENRS